MMNKCCHETYINALQEIIELIKDKKIDNISHLVVMIEFAIKELREKNES